ncbi:MAG: hypothetical protein CL800_04315 [Citromicrobium sp.]|nr:hypothetical protein [Sphingomonadaceae bacterium]MBV01610.1 hypothetical protein [Citromicrobium sp.]PHR03957.1 MAG: hypothetical protein COB31_03925 [Erythrobacter sp.]QPL40940.1 DUF3667 domain-containing protein [Erythrobacter sp. A30-3]HAG36701.1 hypothetical protein [Erythrobacter sp.]|tara:strand:- start:5617 stop:6690 length:1074 start_codon:yes stop_codon:yes gene_type:complete
MSEFGDAFGTAVEGGLFAKAVGRGSKGLPEAAELQAGHFDEGACLNCGTALTGNYCHACGQKAHLHRTLGAFLHDLLHGALHFEGKTWKTLPKLALKPGQLTRRYIEGERASFVSPMGLFLFSVFLMFAVFQIAGIGLSTPAQFGSASRDITHAIENLERERADLRAELSAMEPNDPERSETQADLARVEEQVTTLNSLPVMGAGAKGQTQWKSGIGWFDKTIKKWNDNPNLMLYKLQSNSYKFSWLLIPLSLPFVWLLFFWKRRFRAYDHAIFVTYSIAFMSLLFIVISILVKVGAPEWLSAGLAFIVPPIHIYKQLRHAYDLSRFSAYWRLALLLIFITIIASLFIQLVFFLGAF